MYSLEAGLVQHGPVNRWVTGQKKGKILHASLGDHTPAANVSLPSRRLYKPGVIRLHVGKLRSILADRERVHWHLPGFVTNHELEPLRQHRLEHQPKLIPAGGACSLPL